ncbi:Crp/Fnr family transcriptional regulator [Aneurinibacillus tyrosinisolvens]|uniref:Crp/Fnr family transcriptional regulator n=1 Tax=Aneurinibacillus tyrosinisolvens TaxID=1443435 RepID=UPI001F4062FC|nr:Crp/Fnr family transcriptional regulator [Aneurinibacillus tyrosinisolvens]
MKEEDSQSLNDTISPQLKTLLDSLAVDVQMAKDDYLFNEGNQADKLYMIRSGRIKISKLTAGGREMTLQICDAPEMIGELGFFSTAASYSTTATVLESGTFGVVNQSALEEQLIQNGTLAVEFIKCMGRNYRRTHSKFRDLVLNGKQGAIYSTLIRLANSFGKETDNGVLSTCRLRTRNLVIFAVRLVNGSTEF